MKNKKDVNEILSKAPFNLSCEGMNWVFDTMSGLDLRGKICQLINLQIFPEDDLIIDEVIKNQLGSITLINFSSSDSCKSVVNKVRRSIKIPPLVCADLEGGVTSGNMTSRFPNQLGCAAADDISLYRQALEALSLELISLGINWTFSPVLDVNKSFHSAIVGTRSYGSNPSLISEMADQHIRVFQSRGIATTAKHWPGEGYDDRDQHLVTTINPLPLDHWFEIFGKIYSRVIDAGVMSVMSAHIAFPEFAKNEGETGIELYRPASISKHLNVSLLRDTLKFNGLIVSDATLMGGLESWGPRRQWLPELVKNGCDMILFSVSLVDDIDNLIDSVQRGVLSIQRVDEALIRVLGLKAKLNLYQSKQPLIEALPPINLNEHEAIMSRLSCRSPTLVKDIGKILPIDKNIIKNILIFKEENINPLGGGDGFHIHLDKLLEVEGFQVDVFNSDDNEFKDYLNYDLIIYAIAQESQLTKSRLYLDWSAMHGGTIEGMKRVWWDKPTILISFGHPYYLYDAPRAPCLINAYTPTPDVQKSVVEKLLGRSPFLGKSPIDPFCGLADAIY